MRKIRTTAFTSLDGVMQAPGGPQEDPTGGFAYGGWVATYWDDTLGAAMDEIFAKPFDLLLGRKTYDIFAAYWPYIDGTTANASRLQVDIARKFNAATKHVATHSPATLSWQNSQSLGRDAVARLRELKKENGPDLLTQGSSQLIQTLLAHDLIDELSVLMFPLLLGKGKRLFGQGTTPAALKLEKSMTSPSGALIARYKRAGDVQTGSFAPENPTEAEIERRKHLT